MIPQVTERRGEDGRKRPIDGRSGRLRAAEVIKAKPEASLRAIAAQAGISVGTARSVRERLRSCTGSQKSPESAGQDSGARKARSQSYTDQDLVLRKLETNPALRYTDTGRALIQWLHRNATKEDDLHAISQTIPQHCIPLIADYARHNRDAWGRLVTEFEQAIKSAGFK
jgi:hypothetical protein